MLKTIFDALKMRAKNRQAVEAAMTGNFADAVQHIRDGANPNYSMTFELQSAVDSYPITANIGRAAVAKNNTKVLDELLSLGLNKNLKLGHQRLPLLYFAVAAKSEDAALLLISKGAEIGEDSGFYSVAGIAREFRLTRVLSAIEAKRQAEAMTKRAGVTTLVAAPALAPQKP